MIKGPHEVREGEKRKPGRNFSLIPCIAILVDSGTNYDVKNPLGNFWIEENNIELSQIGIAVMHNTFFAAPHST